MKLKILLFLGTLPSLINSFFIGAATSSYQIEGHNSGINIWDEFTFEHNLHPVKNASNHFLQYEEDIKLLHEMGSKHYRFSISWSRIMPFYWNDIDPNAIQFYHNIIDECLSYNITPYITLYHWDLPQYLNTESINGWLDEEIIYYFKEYSILMFEEYSDKVKHWMTINEPLTTSRQGYGMDCSFAPYKCSLENQFLSAHYQLLAHAHVGYYYLNHYEGEIGLVMNTNWFEPKNEESIGNSHLLMDENLGWFLEPLLTGMYPSTLEKYTQSFSFHEQIILMNSFTFLGINHYTTYYIDENKIISVDPNWITTKANWLFNVPFGAFKVFNYINERYTDTTPIYITECGMPQINKGLMDIERVNYLSGYLSEIMRTENKNIRGFFVWSLLDNFEWARGYNESFGIIDVDYENNYKRSPKLSYYWLQQLNKFILHE